MNTPAKILSDGDDCLAHVGVIIKKRTLLNCPLGNHRGWFVLQRYADTWGCPECIRLAGRQFVGMAIAEQAGRGAR